MNYKCFKTAVIYAKLLTVWLGFGSLGFFVENLLADQVHFKQGGTFRGQYSDQSGVAVIESPLGLTLKIDKPEVEKVIQTSTAQDEYLRRLRLSPVSVAAHWELGEWCREQGMSNKRDFHMQEILKLDQNHEKAHLALGHIREKGEWIDRDKKMLDQGYVKHRGRYITEEEYELIKDAEVANAQERAWFPKVRLWVNWLNGSNQSKVLEGKELLLKITDPAAVKPLSRFLGTQKMVDYRLLYVDILAGIKDHNSTEYLAQQAVIDDEYRVRHYAIEKILLGRQEHALPVVIKYLKNETNVVVRKAAIALGKIGAGDAIPHLINALVTKHQYLVQVPVPVVSSGPRNTSTGTLTGLPQDVERNLLSGQYPHGIIIQNNGSPTPMKTVSVSLEQQNPEVREALVILTGQDFGFHESQWKSWWLSTQQDLGK